MQTEKIRESIIAGSWYPGNPQTLRKEINDYLDGAKVSVPPGELVALIVPHAGYMYSGGVAACAYRILKDHSFDRVIVVAPSHRANFQGASLYHLGGFRTPLGVVPLEQNLIDSLLKEPFLIEYLPKAHDEEHSLEIQLPFLQVVLEEFRLVPIVMGDQSFESCKQLAQSIIRTCRTKRVLLIASTDLSHYHPYKDAKRLDQIVLDRVSAFDPEGLSHELESGNCEACGGGPMITVMLAARGLGADKARVLHYANSGDITGDTRGVVGYMAAALCSNPGLKKSLSHGEGRKAGIDLGLSAEEKQALRQIAHQAIRSRCMNEPMLETHPTTPKLEEQRGAFVCIHKDGKLRGCIGMIEGRAPLHETIRDMAIQAAFADPRFCSLAPEELEGIDLEISVLTPLTQIHEPSDIEIGKHGLLIRKGYHSGLLLPQVATEHGLDRIQFLEWTCRKAGLPPDAWKGKKVDIYVFSADIF